MTGTSWSVEFLKASYKEQKWRTPQRRWLSLIVRSLSSKWHVTVTFPGTIDTKIPFPKRAGDLRNLCSHIDMSRITLLADTVTELVVTSESDNLEAQVLPLQGALDSENEFSPFVQRLRLRICEDSRRVRFPTFTTCDSITAIDLSQITICEELAAVVYKARIHDDGPWFVYKNIERLLYEPRDTEVLERELRNLEIAHGRTGIVQMAAVVTSSNPYQTFETKPSTVVVRGILFEYHSGGTLENALKSPDSQPWTKWARQICEAIQWFHEKEITHMDIKPSNILISKDLDAIVADISGYGGVTYQWLPPEMKDVTEPLECDLESKKVCDVWALGRLMLLMAEASSVPSEEEMLQSIGLAANAEDPDLRISLKDILSRLGQVYGSGQS